MSGITGIHPNPFTATPSEENIFLKVELSWSEIENYLQISNISLTQLLSQCTQLRELNLSGAKISTVNLDEMLKYTPDNLQILDLSSCPNVTNRILDTIGNRFRNLQILDVSNCPILYGDKILQLNVPTIFILCSYIEEAVIQEKIYSNYASQYEILSETYPRARTAFAICNRNGWGRVMNGLFAQDLLMQAEAKKDPYARYYLGNLYLAKYTSSAMCYLQKVADSIALSATCLFYIYHKGKRSIKPDQDLALHYLKLAADNNYPTAEFMLSNHYWRDNRKSLAIQYLNSAANHENINAMIDLASRHKKGDGVLLNLTECIRLLTKAVERGSSEALVLLGDLYRCPPYNNMKKSAEYFRSGVDLDNTNAYFLLALCYIEGKGVEINIAKADDLFAKGYQKDDADKDDICAIATYLGLDYEQGEKVAIDLNKAKYYYSIVAELDQPSRPDLQQDALDRLSKLNEQTEEKVPPNWYPRKS